MASRHINIVQRQLQSGTVTVTTTRSTLGLDGRGTAKLVYGLDVAAFQVVGSGLSDLTPAITAYTAPHSAVFRVVVSTAAGTDKFDWFWKTARGPGLEDDKADQGWTTGALAVAMTGSAQTLREGVTVTFAATTGHTLADEWRFTAARPALHPQSIVTHFQNLDATNKISIAPSLAVARDATTAGGWVLGPEAVLTLNWSTSSLNRLVFIGTANTVMRVWEEGIG